MSRINPSIAWFAEDGLWRGLFETIKEELAVIKDKKGVSRIRDIGSAEQEWYSLWSEFEEKAFTFSSRDPEDHDKSYERAQEMHELLDQLVAGLENVDFPRQQKKIIEDQLVGELRDTLDDIETTLEDLMS